MVPPAKFVHDEAGRRGGAVSSLVAGNCIISGSHIDRSLLFTSVLTRSWSHVEESVILPWCDVGRRARLKKVVLDRGVKIPPGLVVGEDPIFDAKRFRRTDKGVCLITQRMIDKLAL